MNAQDKKVVSEILKDFSIPVIYDDKCVALLDGAKANILLWAFLRMSGSIDYIDRQATEETRLKTFLNDINFNHLDIPLGGISLKIIINGRPIDTDHADISMAVFKELNKIHKKPMGKPSRKPASMRMRLLKSFKPFAKYLYNQKLVVYNGEPSKNKIAKLVERVLQQWGIEDISLQQITKGIF